MNPIGLAPLNIDTVTFSHTTISPGRPRFGDHGGEGAGQQVGDSAEFSPAAMDMMRMQQMHGRGMHGMNSGGPSVSMNAPVGIPNDPKTTPADKYNPDANTFTTYSFAPSKSAGSGSNSQADSYDPNANTSTTYTQTANPNS